MFDTKANRSFNSFCNVYSFPNYYGSFHACRLECYAYDYSCCSFTQTEKAHFENKGMKTFAKIPLLATLLATATATSKQIAEFPQINLTPNNEKSPFIGFPNATGVASVQLHYDPAAVTGRKRKICIQTNIVGFVPRKLKIYKAKMTRNGAAPYVDFSNLLSSDRPTFTGCRFVNQTTFHDIRENSVSRRRPSLSAIVAPFCS